MQMRIGGGAERWMVLLPFLALAVLVIVYVGGPANALDLIERMAHSIWDQAELMLRR
jgi:hypothetical protein